jgi:hypothetical protein
MPGHSVANVCHEKWIATRPFGSSGSWLLVTLLQMDFMTFHDV